MTPSGLVETCTPTMHCVCVCDSSEDTLITGARVSVAAEAVTTATSVDVTDAVSVTGRVVVTGLTVTELTLTGALDTLIHACHTQTDRQTDRHTTV